MRGACSSLCSAATPRAWRGDIGSVHVRQEYMKRGGKNPSRVPRQPGIWRICELHARLHVRSRVRVNASSLIIIMCGCCTCTPKNTSNSVVIPGKRPPRRSATILLHGEGGGRSWFVDTLLSGCFPPWRKTFPSAALASEVRRSLKPETTFVLSVAFRP